MSKSKMGKKKASLLKEQPPNSENRNLADRYREHTGT